MSEPTSSEPTPTEGQLAWQRAGFGMFCHFGINTFHRREWSDGTLDPRTFAPRRPDADQWAQAAVDAGMRYLVLTAKHHDGFCLWPTATTDYSVASSPWRDGRGDVVAEVAAACERAGIGLGLYLSPWDRNAACYGDPAAYDTFYCRQLTELLTRYGELFEIWFDGAGSEGRTYDWEAIMDVIGRHQPQAMVFNMGRPTIRWIGNEDGLAADPCAYAVERTPGSVGGDLPADSPAAAAPGAGGLLRYLPPECDVPIRDGWFWHPDNADTLKSREHLLGIAYRSLGLGANLLLNVPPDRSGLLDDADTGRLREVTAELRRRFAEPIRGRLDQEGDVATVRFAEPVTCDHLVLAEDLARGQRIDGHAVLADGRPIAAGRTVGVRRVHAFDAVTATELTVRLDGPGARLDDVTAYRTGFERAPQVRGA